MRQCSRTGDDLVNEDDERRDATDDITSICNMDKLEVFFKYTAVKAELDKAELEQDALLDVLRKTRSTLSDVRSQRDNLNPELKREKQLTALVKQELFQSLELRHQSPTSRVVPPCLANPHNEPHDLRQHLPARTYEHSPSLQFDASRRTLKSQCANLD
ncbi:hypothetical protein NBRC10513_004378 [Rhodotorula toruloides]